jgi:hypothetical protein
MNNKVILIGLLGASALTYLIYYLNNKKSNNDSSSTSYSDIVFSDENPDEKAYLLADKLAKSANEKYADFYKYKTASEQEKINQYVEIEKKDPAFQNTNIIPDRIFINDSEQPRGILY